MITTILAIDDNEDDLLHYHRAFKDYSSEFRLVAVDSAEAGFDFISGIGAYAVRPDLIMLDYNMPEMDGLSFVKKLSVFSEQPIPVIMLTSQGDTAIAVEAMKNGVDDYIVKDVEGRYLKLLPGVAGHVMSAHRQRSRIQQLRCETELLLLRNQILMQNSMDGIHIMDMQGNLVEANTAFCRMLGYQPEEVARLNVADWDAQWTQEDLLTRFEAMKGRNFQFETVHRRKDGSLLDVEISIASVEIEGEYFIFASSRDITARKKAETVQAQHKLIIDTSIDGFWLCDMQGYLLEANEAYARMSGYTIEELIGMHISELEANERLPEVEAHIAKLMEQGCDRFETRHRRKDSTEIDIEISVTLMKDVQRMAVFSHDISQRKKNEATLLQNEAHWRAMLDNSPYLTWLKDTQGRYIAANRIFADFVRVDDVKEIAGKTDLEMWPRELAEKYRADDAEVMATRRRKHFEERTQDGDRLLWVETFKAPVIDAHGNVLGTVGTASDITERKAAELKLLRASSDALKREAVMAHQFGQLLQSSFNEIYLFDAATLKFLKVSEGARRNLGYTDEELAHLTPLDLNAAYTPGGFEALIAPLTSGERPSLLFESSHRRKDGTVYLVEVRLQLMKDGISAFLAIVQDITERRAAEERMRLHSNILNNLAEGVSLVRAKDGVIVFANPQFERMFGYDPDELFGMHVSRINAPGELGAEAVAEQINGVLEKHGTWSGEIQNLRKNGEAFWCQASISGFNHSEFGKVWVAVHEDISDRKQAECQMRELSAHLQTVREEEKASLAREIHDDLGGTLAALKLDASWIAGKLKGVEGQEPLGVCVKSMIELLDSAVQATRRIITDLRPTMLDDLGLLETLRWQAAEFRKRTGIECRVLCDSEERRGSALDKPQSIHLFRIFQESLTNIARHSGASRVEIDLYRDGGEIVLKISDNGRGLPSGQPIAATSYGIRGMRERVAQMGGRIDFQSSPGSGLAVMVRLPESGGTAAQY